jgi:general secretion pathway protein G
MRAKGFTLIELLVVMAIIATLLSLAMPKYMGGSERAKEAVLKENLATLRQVIDKYYVDTGKYPANLGELVSRKYLRTVPMDPVADSADSWIVVPYPGHSGESVVYDIKSGAPGKSRDGTPYSEW